ncbi:MAG: SET domain-containing protein [Burkholderiales bacterium]|nr:SET domain-containing protein [Burkholderiales bacterium]
MNTRRDLAVRPVRNGKGIIALRSFRRGATVCRIRGRIVSADIVWGYWRRGNTRRGENCFRFDADRYLDPEGEIGAYANHACNPNTGIVKDARGLKMVAIRPISTGEEITHDYSTLLGADDVWTMRCNCGDARCRRVVRKISKLPDDILRRYHRLGVIPEFILSIRG